MTSGDQILKYLSDKLDEDMERFKEDISLGHAKEFGDYKYACGTVRGLLMSKDHIIQLADRLGRNDDE